MSHIIIFKLLKTTLERSQIKKKDITYEDVRITEDFSSETMQTKKQSSDTFKVPPQNLST